MVFDISRHPDGLFGQSILAAVVTTVLTNKDEIGNTSGRLTVRPKSSDVSSKS